MKGNTPERWGSVSIALHWTIAVLVLLVQLPIGLTMVSIGQGAVQNLLYTTHKMTGLVIFALAVVRLGWRWANPVPALPADLPGWQWALARLTHALLYLLLLLMPVTGFLYTAMGGFPVPLFGLYDLDRLVPDSKPWAEVFKAAHLSLQYAVYGVVALHLAGALQHYFIRRDGVLERMLSSTATLQESRSSAAAEAGLRR